MHEAEALQQLGVPRRRTAEKSSVPRAELKATVISPRKGPLRCRPCR